MAKNVVRDIGRTTYSNSSSGSSSTSSTDVATAVVAVVVAAAAFVVAADKVGTDVIKFVFCLLMRLLGHFVVLMQSLVMGYMLYSALQSKRH